MPLQTLALDSPHLGYLRRLAHRKRIGLTDFREDLSQCQEEELDGFPAPQISTVRLCYSLSDQTHPCSKSNPEIVISLFDDIMKKEPSTS